MPTYEKILCPVDFSEFSKCALAFAKSIAWRYGSKLFVQHVVGVQHGIEAGLTKATFYEEYRGFLRSSGEKDLRAFLKDNSVGDLESVPVLSEGVATDAILGLAADENVDLIVMGTHGRRGRDRFMLGSVTERVVERAACAVVTVHGRSAEFAQATRLPSTRGGKILLCTDLSDRSRRAFDYSWSLAAEYGAELTLVHVLETVPGPSSLYASISHARQCLENAVPPEECQLPRPHVAIRIGKPYEEIVALAAEGEFDAVVMSARGEGVSDPAVFGSTTHRVIQLGPCPVLVVPS